MTDGSVIKRIVAETLNAFGRIDVLINNAGGLVARTRIEVYSELTQSTKQPDYGRHDEYGPTNAVPLVLDGVEVGSLSVQELLP